MVGLNGRALPEFEIEQDHPLSVNYANADKHNDMNHQCERPSPSTPRRIRSTQAVRGPKPLLPRSLKEALQLAELLSKSKLIPKGFETPETCLVGILYGMEVGLSPIAALQRMAVIDGRPTIWGDAALALVQASGLLQSIKEDVIEGTAMNADSESVLANTKVFEVSTSTSNSTSASTSTSTAIAHQFNLTAVCTVRREGRSEPIIGSFSIEDAKRAGLWQKPGPWTDYPKRMLIMRARAFALRDAFPDVLAGLYIREEFVGKERQVVNPEQDRSADNAEWRSPDVQPDFGKTNPKTSNSVNDISLWDFEIGSQAAQSKGPSRVGDTQNEEHLPSRPQPQTADRRRAPPPPMENVEQKRQQSASDQNAMADAGTPDSDSVDMGLRVGEITSSEYPQSSLDTNTASSETETGATVENHLDPDTLLDLLDSALCCALDLPTLEEIVDDFAGRLTPLSKDHQKRAQKIIDRHQKRVQDLDQSDQSSPDNRIQPSDLPRGLKSLLPNLGIGRRTSTRRLETRGNRLARSLASWNARQPLIPPNVKLEDMEDVPAQDHTPEVSE